MMISDDNRSDKLVKLSTELRWKKPFTRPVRDTRMSITVAQGEKTSSMQNSKLNTG